MIENWYTEVLPGVWYANNFDGSKVSIDRAFINDPRFIIHSGYMVFRSHPDNVSWEYSKALLEYLAHNAGSIELVAIKKHQFDTMWNKLIMRREDSPINDKDIASTFMSIVSTYKLEGSLQYEYDTNAAA